MLNRVTETTKSKAVPNQTFESSIGAVHCRMTSPFWNMELRTFDGPQYGHLDAGGKRAPMNVPGRQAAHSVRPKPHRMTATVWHVYSDTIFPATSCISILPLQLSHAKHQDTTTMT